MTEKTGIPAFKEFLDSVQASKHEDYATRPNARVAHENAFAEMKAHILKLYDQVDVHHSFEDVNGGIFDCIPIEQQPSLRGLTKSIPKPPDIPRPERGTDPKDERKANLIGSPMGPDRRDKYGNVMHCPEGTIPMRRVTLENLTQFETLSHFFQKGPGEVLPPQISPSGIAPSVPASHRWAHAYQNVDNLGGHSRLNLWDPQIASDQIFSLCQHWYVAGNQTLECGWQVYPQFYGNTNPVLFTYWTADGYNKTGCYNLSCSAFVQTSSSITPGMALGPISVRGGTQYEIELAYYYYQGNWWLYFNGTAASNTIGYYPSSIYQGGPHTKSATGIDYGGEVVGTDTFPPMGSGVFANAGFQQAAYQAEINYYPPGGGTVSASLTPSDLPICYTAQLANYADPWDATLWYGGPGGNC